MSGVKEIETEQSDDGRRVTQHITYSNGNVHSKIFEVPAVVYRGVYTPGEYTAGDAATHGGSVWIARRETQEKPGDGDDWQLAVKRGRDGKDGGRS